MNEQTISERLKEGIKQCGFSLTEIANRTGISLRSLKNYSCGKTVPSLRTFCKLKNALHLNADYILQIGKYAE